MKQNQKRILKTVLGAIWWAFIALLIFVVIWVLGAKLQGRVPSLFGYSVLNVVSGSMEEEISAGSYILVKACAPEDVKKGQIISFYSDDPTLSGLPNTHRVVEEPKKTEHGIEFVTRGDANPVADTVPARGDALIGVYVGELGFLSVLSDMMTGGGIFAVLLILQGASAAMMIFHLIKKKETQEGSSKDPDNT